MSETAWKSAALAALVELSKDAVYAVDAQQNVQFWNTAAQELLGYRASEVLGEHCRKVSRCESCIQGCGLQDFRNIEDQALTLYHRDGYPIKLLKSARAFYDDKDRFLGGIEILRPLEKEQKISKTKTLKTLNIGESIVSAEDLVLEAPREPPTTFHGLITIDKEVKKLFSIIEDVANAEVPVLVRGQSGTGKELIARAIHQESSRRDQPFIAINCAAMSPELMESELFGHVKGAFTGAVNAREGIFAQADGGTLFLDEVAELPLSLQAKLLRVLESHEVVPVGGDKSKKVDVRMVSATHRSLREEVHEGRFREDLKFRLRVVPVFLPPLKERIGDIEELLIYFMKEHNQKGHRKIERIHQKALDALRNYSWPGNVRELKNVVAYAFAMGHGTVLYFEQLPPEFKEAAQQNKNAARAGSFAQNSAESSLIESKDCQNEMRSQAPREVPFALSPRQLKEEQERMQMKAALGQYQGRISEAAEAVGMSRATFWRKRKKYNI